MKFKKKNRIFHSNYDGTIDCRMWQQINVSIRGQCNHGISLRYRLFKKTNTAKNLQKQPMQESLPEMDWKLR